MEKLIAFCSSEMGRRAGVWVLGALALAAQGGLIPIDLAIPYLGITVGQLLTYLGVSLAATAGSSSRK